MNARYFGAIRKAVDDGHEFLLCSEIGATRLEVEIAWNRTIHDTSQWCADNPVDRIAEFQLIEVEP